MVSANISTYPVILSTEDARQLLEVWKDTSYMQIKPNSRDNDKSSSKNERSPSSACPTY